VSVIDQTRARLHMQIIPTAFTPAECRLRSISPFIPARWADDKRSAQGDEKTGQRKHMRRARRFPCTQKRKCFVPFYMNPWGSIQTIIARFAALRQEQLVSATIGLLKRRCSTLSPSNCSNKRKKRAKNPKKKSGHDRK
jgi:hypothetical protein